MNKNDFEVLLLYVFIQGENGNKSNYELSRLLCIPEAKIKRLRYEVDLKYGTKSEMQYRKEKLDQLKGLLKNVSLKNEGNCIEFVVEDIALRQFLDNILKSKNRFSDSSFNSEIVKISIRDLELLLRESIEDNRLCDELLKEANSLLVDRTVELKDIIPALFKIITNPPSIVDVTLPTIIKLCNKYSEPLVSYFKRK